LEEGKDRNESAGAVCRVKILSTVMVGGCKGEDCQGREGSPQKNKKLAHKWKGGKRKVIKRGGIKNITSDLSYINMCVKQNDGDTERIHRERGDSFSHLGKRRATRENETYKKTKSSWRERFKKIKNCR
jgi:hypothetical protein